MASVSRIDAGRLAGQIAGEVVMPGHHDYDLARRVWNGMIDRRPALIVRCTSAADVAAALEFASHAGLRVAVRGGSHNIAGNATCDDGLVVDLSPMQSVEVDIGARRARAGGGVTWGVFDEATQRHGLATTGGLIPTTGIAGFTLGGGLGHLMRSCGLACDNLLSAEVVTADGTTMRTDQQQHPDLFWALRGGGGNFGVVTEFEFRLHQVGPVLLGGRIAHPLSAARQALRFYRDFCAEAPDSVIVYAGLATGPDGQLRLGWRAVVNGSAEDGEPLIAPLRGYGTPLLDDIRPQPYLDIQRIIEPLFLPGRLNYWKANFVDELSDALIDILIDAMTRVPSPYTLIAIEPMGGAIARVPQSATAFQHRSASFSLLILSGWEDPADTDVNVTWTRELFARTEPLCSAGVYVNYLGLEGDQRVRDAFGMNYDGLVQVKQRYDPHNFFRLNQNIAPA